MFTCSDIFLKQCLCLLFLSSAGIVVSASEANISVPGLDTSDLNTSLMYLQGLDNLLIPTPPVQITDFQKTDSSAKNNTDIVSTLALVDTRMNTMGNAVLVPITPTPEGSGYSYYNTTGTDPGYLIYGSGTYTLQDGFSTDNSSAIRIGASDVILDGNAQTITGNLSNAGITIKSGETNATVKNFAGIREFYNGIDSSGDQVTLINNSLSGNYLGGISAIGSDLSMSQNILFNNSEFGIFAEGIGVRLTENSIHDNPGYGFYFYSDNIALDKNTITKNGHGIIGQGNNSVISENKILNNYNYGIEIAGDRAIITDNVISQNYNNLYSYASNATIEHNTISSTTAEYGTGIWSIAHNVTISENTASNNGYGIIAIGDSCTARNNRAYGNNLYGIAIQGSNITISDNIIRDTTLYGMASFGNNSVMQNNIVTNAMFGVGIVDFFNTTVIGNQVTGASRCGLMILDTGDGIGEGAIYNNYFGSQTNIEGYSNFSNYSYIWTNPAGPQRGTNVMGGPFIAGNYWSNTNGTGWSDRQTPNVTGYNITTPYEVKPGMYDTAPLVPQKSVLINATANDWSLIVPRGNSSYQSYTNQTFITQAKPGAELTDVLVDTESKGNVTNWTFTQVSENHEIQAIGNAKPGQVLVFFNASPRWGEMPLTVSFSSEQSLGSPTSWYWQFGDGIANTTQNPVHTYETPGTYTVTLRATNGMTGGYGVWNNYITVTDGPVPEPTQTPVPGKIITQFSAYPASGNVPLTVDFTDMSTGNPISWNWDFGDGTQSSQQNPSHIYTTVGSYPVTLSVTNANYGGSLNIQHAVTVT